MSPRLECDVSEVVWLAIEERRRQGGGSLGSTVDALLSEALDIERHTLFQVSTSTALVQGVFGAAITVGQLQQHGDTGLGTFAGLDGEMIMIDGACYRATAGGAVSAVPPETEVPFAMIARFAPDSVERLSGTRGLADLTSRVDQLRPSENLFAAVRADGHFDSLAMRAICKAHPGETLLQATWHQSEFSAADLDGSLVGFWSPEYSAAVSVPGYHLHFISTDRAVGGHVLDMHSSGLEVRLHTESDLHLALPGTSDFLRADLSGDHRSELSKAETEAREDLG